MRRTSPGAVVAAVIAGLVSLTLGLGCLYTLQTGLSDPDDRAVKLLENPNPKGVMVAQSILKRSPYTPRVASALALNWARAGDIPRASKLMAASGDLSWRDMGSNLWLFETALKSGNLKVAIDRVDAALRIRPEISQVLFPALLEISKNAKAGEEIANHMAASPDWRPALINSLSVKSDPSVTFDVLMHLNATRSPPTAAEVSGYLMRLVEMEHYDESLLGLFLFLPPQKMASFKNIFNGDFRQLDGIPPFDWSMKAVSGASLSLENGPSRENDQALHVLYQGSDSGGLLSQFIVLAEGAYRFSGETVNTGSEDNSSLQWSIRCYRGEVLGKQQVSAYNDWRRFQFDVAVPAGCRSQVVELQVSPGDRRVNLDTWFDRISIQRIDTP